jgi:hypothetical protein
VAELRDRHTGGIMRRSTPRPRTYQAAPIHPGQHHRVVAAGQGVGYPMNGTSPAIRGTRVASVNR